MPRFSFLLRPSPGRLTPVPRGCPPCIPVDAGSLDVSSASPSPISHPRAAIVTIPAPRCTNELYRPTQGVRLTAAHTLLGSPAWVQTSDRRDFALQDIYERGLRRGASFYTVSQLHSSDGYKTRTQPRDVTGVCSFGQKRRHTHPYCHRGRGSRYRQQREMGISCSCLPRVSEGYDCNNVSDYRN